MDFNGSMTRLSMVCGELLARMNSQVCIIDAFFVSTVVEQLFCDPQIDLLAVFPTSSTEYDEYNQVLGLVGVKSSVFKVSFHFQAKIFDFE